MDFWWDGRWGRPDAWGLGLNKGGGPRFPSCQDEDLLDACPPRFGWSVGTCILHHQYSDLYD
jgi:hypothetical protein